MHVSILHVLIISIYLCVHVYINMVRFFNYLTVKVRQDFFHIKKDLRKIFIKFFYVNFKEKKSNTIMKKQFKYYLKKYKLEITSI